MRLTHSRLWRKKVVPGLSIALLLIVMFFTHQCWVWEIWSCVQCARKGCTEAVYQVNGSSWHSVVKDEDVKKQCGVYSKQDNSWQKLLQHFSAEADTSPCIFTKCGRVIPKLISFKGKITKPDSSSTKTSKVPNIVHYVTFGAYEFTFLHYVCMTSAHRHIQPYFIYFHGDSLPFGKWWKRLLTEIPNVYFVYRERPVWIQGYKTPWVEHSSDIMRLVTLWDNGGIYLDTDLIVLKPLTELMQYDYTMGRVNPKIIGDGVILSKPKAPFLCLWMQNFRTYFPLPWRYTTWGGETAHQLAQDVPDQLHIEVGTLYHPNSFHTDLLYRQNMDWSSSYTMHIWKRQGHVPSSPEQTHHLDNTLGEVMRYIYYGNKSIIEDGIEPWEHAVRRVGMEIWDRMSRIVP